MSQYILPTFSGKVFDLLAPAKEMICIEDIAHHLSIENRFCGSTRFPYSVAYHSILVCRKAPEHLKLEALLHDAEEAYYKDFPYWWKKVIREELGTNLWKRSVLLTKALIDDMFCLEFSEHTHKIIKIIDMRVAETEKYQLLANPEPFDQPFEPYTDMTILNLSSRNVEELFLAEFEKWRRN